MNRAKIANLGRNLAMLVGAGALGVASFASMTGSASADAVNTFKNQATGRCLDDSSAGLRTVGCNGTTFQKWNVHVWGDQTRQLKSLSTGECLDDSSIGLRTFRCWPGSDDNSKFQSWF